MEKAAAEQNTCTNRWGQCGGDVEEGGEEKKQTTIAKKKKKKATVLANLKLSFSLQEKTLQHALVPLPHPASQRRQEGCVHPARGGSQARACPAAGEPHVMTTASSSIW